MATYETAAANQAANSESAGGGPVWLLPEHMIVKLTTKGGGEGGGGEGGGEGGGNGALPGG